MEQFTAEEREAIQILDELIGKAMAVFQEVKDCGLIPSDDQEKLYDLVAGIQTQMVVGSLKPDSPELASTLLANLATAYNLGRMQSGGFW